MTDGTPDYAVVGIWLNGVNDASDCVAPPTASPSPTIQDKEIKYMGETLVVQRFPKLVNVKSALEIVTMTAIVLEI